MTRLRTGAIAALLLGLQACSSPTLPLPPPVVEELRVTNDRVTVEGSAIPGAMVFAWNRDLGTGAIDEADEDDGSFFLVLEGQAGDLIAVWQRDVEDDSPIIERIVPPAAE